MGALAVITCCWAMAATGAVAFAALRRPSYGPARGSRQRVLLVRPADTLLDRERLAVGQRADARLVRTVIAAPDDPHVAGVAWLASNPSCKNRKVGHLLAARQLLFEDEVLVCADADVRVDDALVQDLASAIEGGAALAVAVPRTSGGKGVAAAALSGVIDSSLMSFAVQAVFSGSRAICGKAIAFSPAMLDRLEQVSDVVAEDLALAEIAQRERRSIVTVGREAHVMASREDGLRAVLQRMTRWLVAAKTQRPLGYFGLPLFIAPTPLLLVLAGSSAYATAAVAIALLARTWLAVRLSGHRLSPRPLAWLAGEALLLCAWILALPARTVVWRGRTLALTSGGRIVRAQASS